MKMHKCNFTWQSLDMRVKKKSPSPLTEKAKSTPASQLKAHKNIKNMSSTLKELRK